MGELREALNVIAMGPLADLSIVIADVNGGKVLATKAWNAPWVFHLLALACRRPVMPLYCAADHSTRFTLSFFAPFLIENRSRGGRRLQDHRKVLDGIFWITRTGSPWRDLPADFGNWNSVHRQYRRWTEAGIWDVMLAALAESDAAATTMQMIDSTIVRAHQHAAGGKGGSTEMLLAVRAVGSRPSFIRERMRRALPSASA